MTTPRPETLTAALERHPYVFDTLPNEVQEAINQRDDAQDWADRLAEAIAAHFGEDIGEHSSLNNPWQNALESIPALAAALAAKEKPP